MPPIAARRADHYTVAVQRRSTLHLRRLILPVYLPMLLLSAGMAVPSAAFPQYLGELGASVAVVGVILSLRGLGNLIIDLPGGILLGRVGLRPVTVISIAVSIVAELVAGLRGGELALTTVPADRTVGSATEAVDPVCGMTVSVGPGTEHLQIAGQDYWFCSRGCRTSFAATKAGA